MNILSLIFTPLVIMVIIMVGIVVISIDLVCELFEQMIEADKKDERGD